MDYKVVICSHQRIDTLRKKTLAVLAHYGIPEEKIFIFVAPEEVSDYQTAFPSYQIRQGALGLAPNRNAASDFFPQDERLFFMDDDIKGYYTFTPDNKCKKISNLDMTIREGFALAADRGASLWGFFPTKNAKWMSDTITEGLVFCYGCTYGVYNKKEIRLEFDLKEDYERCLKFYERDECIVRINWVSPDQSYGKGKGGLSDTRTIEKEKEACLRLIQRYPNWARQKFRPDGSRYDLLFPRGLYTKGPHQT